jgi:MYXO-CTERM domain-containing protein
MSRLSALVLLSVVLPGSAWAQDFSSEPELLTFRAQHPVVDQGFNFPIGLELDLIFDTYWIGVDITLEGLANFGLIMEGRSEIDWSSRDGNDGVVYQTIEPLTGGNSIGITGEANFRVSFDIRDGNVNGSPIISIGLLSESVFFDVVTRDFVPFLLPGQQPSYETVTSNSTDGAIRLPFNLDILDVGILSIGAGFEIIGYPTVTATISGESLATIHDNDVFELDRTSRPTPIQLYEKAPELVLESAYTAFIQSFMGYVVTANMSFNITLFGIDIFPLNIPLFDQTFNLFSGDERVHFPTLEYSHPLPMVEIPMSTIDVGSVNVGSTQTFTVPINNDGYLELVGVVGLQGDPAFGAAPPNINANPGGQDAVIITFSPTEDREYTATLLLESSDPVEPLIEIPIVGLGKAPVDDDPFGGFNDDNPYEDGGGSSLYSTCGCASGRTGPQNAAPLAALLLALGLRRRRA